MSSSYFGNKHSQMANLSLQRVETGVEKASERDFLDEEDMKFLKKEKSHLNTTT